jgi:hypothetical protein
MVLMGGTATTRVTHSEAGAAALASVGDLGLGSVGASAGVPTGVITPILPLIIIPIGSGVFHRDLLPLIIRRRIPARTRTITRLAFTQAFLGQTRLPKIISTRTLSLAALRARIQVKRRAQHRKQFQPRLPHRGPISTCKKRRNRKKPPEGRTVADLRVLPRRSVRNWPSCRRCLAWETFSWIIQLHLDG